MQTSKLSIRLLESRDIPQIAEAFAKLGWHKPASQYEQYLLEQKLNRRSIYVALRAIDSLKILFAPFLPFTSQKLHGFLGYDGKLAGEHKVVDYAESTRNHLGLTYDPTGVTASWAPSLLQAGQALRTPAPLFKKLEESVAVEERARLGQ